MGNDSEFKVIVNNDYLGFIKGILDKKESCIEKFKAVEEEFQVENVNAIVQSKIGSLLNDLGFKSKWNKETNGFVGSKDNLCVSIVFTHKGEKLFFFTLTTTLVS